MLTLRKPLEDLSAEEKEALYEEFSTESFWAAVDEGRVAVDALRGRIASGEATLTSDQLMSASVWHDDVVTALNYVENSRIAMHVGIALVERQVKLVTDSLQSAACSWCEWQYRDEAFEWPADRDVTEEDIQGVHQRIRAVLREHVMICPNHPMRALEAQLAALVTAGERVVEGLGR